MRPLPAFRIVVVVGCAAFGWTGQSDATTVEVTTVGFTFAPANVTIESGDSINFTGLLGGFHTVAAVDNATATSWNGEFHSPAFASSFTQVFNSPGVFHYICEPHVLIGMRGKVTVQEGPVCNPPCVNGTCTATNTCTCDLGWTGADCSTPVCDPACVNGICTAPDTCTCDLGWTGADCSTPVCDPACVDGICTAPDTCTSIGACCDPTSGTCSLLTREVCEGIRGRFGGEGSICDTAFNPPCVVPISISLELVAGGGGAVAGAGGGTLTAPLMVTNAGDGSGRLFIVDQIGQIRIVDAGGTLLPTPFLDLASKLVSLGIVFGPGFVFDERGLLGLAFHPNYATNGKFYVRYSAPRTSTGDEPCDPVNFPFTTIGGDAVGCHKAILAEYTVSGNPDVADAGSEVILFSVDEPQFNHNSGHVAFGPDGLLYWTLGDGGGANDGLADDPISHGPGGNAQNIETALGNILRIDVDCGSPPCIPAGNPFAGPCPDGFPDCVPEIYAFGFRNPYRFSFGQVSAQDVLIVADVGQDLFEEVDLVPVEATPGFLNYGWVILEGFSCFDPLDPINPPATCATTGPLGEDLLDPVLDYDHSIGIAVIGGSIYEGSYPPLVGKYVFGDFSQDFGPTGRLFYVDVDGAEAFELREFFLAPDGLPLGQAMFGLGVGEDGEMYVCASDNIGPVGDVGVVYRIVAPTPAQSTLGSRYLSIHPPPSPDPFALAVTADCSGAETKYVGTPFVVVTPSGPERIAFLVDDANAAARLTSADWGSVVHVTGFTILPEFDYKIQSDFGTVGSPVLSGAILATTNIWANMRDPLEQNVSFSDVGDCVDKFKDIVTAPPIHRADTVGVIPSFCLPNQVVSFSDVGATVDSFKSILLDCPSPCPE